MQEILDQVLDYLKGIWIKRRYIMIATWLICPIGWYLVAQMPNVYKSTAKISVDTDSLLRPLLRGLTVENNPDAKVNYMIKTLLTRPNLEKIARMTDLDIQANTPAEFDNIIDNLKDSISLEKSGGNNIYNIDAENKDAQLAKNIVQATLTVFIENTLGETRSDSDSAQKFLDTQLKEYENSLLAAEARRTEFKQKYSGMLPNQAGGFYGALKIEKERLKEAELQLREAQTRLTAVKSQLSNENYLKQFSNKVTESGQPAFTTQYDERIAQMESNLDSLLVRYTDQHPDVKEVTRVLDSLKAQRDKEIDSYLNSVKNNADSTGISNTGLENNPLYQEMKLQTNNLEAEVASLNVRVREYKANVTDLEAKIHTVPEIESEMIALDRGYEIKKQQYEELLRRQETAQLAQQADNSTEKISFKVLEQARVPKEPSGPKRIIFFIGITFVAFAAGIGLSLLTSQLRPIVTSASQLNRATGIPILGIVSATENLQLKKWHTKKTIIFVMSNALLLLVLMGFVSYFLFPDAVQAPLRRIF